MPAPHLDTLYGHYDAILNRIPHGEKFDSHRFIQLLTKKHQRDYIQHWPLRGRPRTVPGIHKALWAEPPTGAGESRTSSASCRLTYLGTTSQTPAGATLLSCAAGLGAGPVVWAYRPVVHFPSLKCRKTSHAF